MPATNAKGLAIIEGDEGCVLYAYDDANDNRIEPGDHIVGTLTIGYGHTGPDVHPGQTITQAEAVSLLRADVHGFEVAVDNLVSHDINSNQFSALVSFAYNCGSGTLAGSPILAKLNAGDVAGAAAHFGDYVQAVGPNGEMQVDAGLVKRRAQERALFLEPC
jgi:lysozyme